MYKYRSFSVMECKRCGTCCIAPDISALLKGSNERCVHLTESLLCEIYDTRPDVCRNYTPWELCEAIQDEELETRVQKYLAAFGIASGAQLPMQDMANTPSVSC